jgi:cytochrome c peroxidase
MKPQDGSRLLRSLRWLIALVPATAAIAQMGPLPPLGPPPVPPGNPITTAKASLGKALFWDEQLSSTGTVACGTCHRAASGGSDPRSAPGTMASLHPGSDLTIGTPDDITGSPGVSLHDAGGAFVWSATFGLDPQVTSRRAPSHINAAYSPLLFWDGRAGVAFNDPVTNAPILPNNGALENQATGPPLSDAEMAHMGRDWADVETRIAAATPLALASNVPPALATWIAGRSYPALFTEAFGSPQVTAARIALAIATYERTQFSNQAPVDSAGAVLTPDEAAGRNLFGTLPCARCHAGPLTSDNQFHYIGVRPANEDPGRFAVTGNAADRGAFRTPSLRNVALRPSFMHNGRFRTLEEVIDFYNRGGDFNAPNKSPLITPLNLNPLQRAQLVAFLRRPLTDPRVASEAAPFDRPTLYVENGRAPLMLQDTGVAGGGGRVPEVVALDPPLAGNARFTVGVYHGLAGATATLVIDIAEPPAGGGIPASGSFARVETTLLGTGAGDGYGSATIAIPDDPALHGQIVFGRWFVSDPAAPGGVSSTRAFRMQIFGAGGEGLTAVTGGVATPRGGMLRLHAGRPNPFGLRTSIRYDVYVGSPVSLTIYDIGGRLVRRLVEPAFHAQGTYTAEWDGRDDHGRSVTGGVYFSRLEGGGTAESYRVIRVD